MAKIYKEAEFVFEGLQALQHIDLPSTVDAVRNSIYSYSPSFGDLGALSLGMNAPNFPKWAKTAKEAYKNYNQDKLPQRIAKTALDTGGQVLRDSEGWGNPIADVMSATYRNVRGVADKQKELGRKLTRKEVLRESAKAALQTAKAQVVTRPKFYFYDAPKMGLEAAKTAKNNLPKLASKLRQAIPRRNNSALSMSFTHFRNF